MSNKIAAVHTEPCPGSLSSRVEHVTAVRLETDLELPAAEVIAAIRNGARYHMVGLSGRRNVRVESCPVCDQDILIA